MKKKDEEKMPAGKEPTGGVQDIAPPRCSFLRRKVASPVDSTSITKECALFKM
jgi:hypothetical protein